jgi:hypothetical protein
MHTPSAALTWELWLRHRTRLLVLAAVLLAFIMIYPMLCAIVGLDPAQLSFLLPARSWH